MSTQAFLSSRIRVLATIFVVLLLALRAPAVAAPPVDAAGIRQALARLRVVGSCLYVAAHPDDENTAFLAWLAQVKKVRAGYLSLTRGDGGQNLIGSESGAELGWIRTQELLAARKIDGAEQLFSRAVDFGFSKGPEETLRIWGKEEILADVVLAIRSFQPDVVVTRFPTTGEGGHGQHTASALLAEEAFRAAGDPARFPEQLRSVATWQPRRLFWNAWPREPGEGPPPPASPPVVVDTGVFVPLLGRSLGEIAAESRSVHRSQGFGTAARRGSSPESFELLGGEPAAGDLFGGIDLSWRRIPGGEEVDRILSAAERELDVEAPWKIVPRLLEADGAMAKLPGSPLVRRKRGELADLVAAAAGLRIEATAAQPEGVPGSDVRVAVGAINRSPLPIVLEGVVVPDEVTTPLPPPPAPKANRWNPVRPNQPERPSDRPLPADEPFWYDTAIHLPPAIELTQPFWLREPAAAGSWRVASSPAALRPENDPAETVRFRFRFEGRRFELAAPLLFRRVDPVLGERLRPFEVVPPATVRFDDSPALFPNGDGRSVVARITAAGSPFAGTARFSVPAGWSVEPASVKLELAAGGERTIALRVRPTSAAAPSTGRLSARLESPGRSEGWSRTTIDHPHIPVATLLRPAEVLLVRADVATRSREVGYVVGAGDRVPEALRQLGFRVTQLSDDDLESGSLDRFGAIVLGIRAWNTRPRLAVAAPRLFAWVEKGGRLVTQYVTPDDTLPPTIAPVALTVTRDRVVDETAAVRFAEPASRVLSAPNRLSAADFDGWVQERGLSFAADGGEGERPLEMADPGEPPKRGSLVVVRVGKGTFVYTGLALFRQLPAGVPGAYRILANLLGE